MTQALLGRLHAAQNGFYAGGRDGPVRELLHPDVEWVVPGSSPIAGCRRLPLDAAAFDAVWSA